MPDRRVDRAFRPFLPAGAPYTGGVILSIWELLLVGFVLWTTCVAAAALTGGFLLWRGLRRRWRAIRSHGAVVGAVALWGATESVRHRKHGSMTAIDLERWPARMVRRELWRSVDRAAAAVRVADEAGGPTAELPALSRRIRAAAVDLDRLLRVDPSARVPAVVGEQALELIRAADDIREAAVASAGEVSAQRVHDLTRDAGLELEILDAGLASARAVLPPQA